MQDNHDIAGKEHMQSEYKKATNCKLYARQGYVDRLGERSKEQKGEGGRMRAIPSFEKTSNRSGFHQAVVIA